MLKKLTNRYFRWLGFMMVVGMIYPAFAIMSSLPIPREIFFFIGMGGVLAYGFYRYQSFEGVSPDLHWRLTLRDKRLWFMTFLLLMFGFVM